MLNLLPFATMCLVVVLPGTKEPEELALKSNYSPTFLVDGARQVRLKATLDPKGNGNGTLALDPNIVDEWGSTCIAIQEYSVSIKLVESKEQSAKGRRLYEIRVKGDEGMPEGQPRWLLIRPVVGGTPTLLVFLDDKGKFQDVLALQ
jgi:hypothetical protein